MIDKMRPEDFTVFAVVVSVLLLIYKVLLEVIFESRRDKQRAYAGVVGAIYSAMASETPVTPAVVRAALAPLNVYGSEAVCAAARDFLSHCTQPLSGEKLARLIFLMRTDSRFQLIAFRDPAPFDGQL